MHTLVVVAHPDPQSLSHHVANQLAAAASERDGCTVELADIVAEDFDPRFTKEDRASYRAGSGYPADVLAEQARIERAQHLVLVFPVWWWSVPGVLKGWLDRVFANGWAFGHAVGPDADVAANSHGLSALTIHLVPIASGNEEGYDRHGYDAALSTQLEHGVIDYCAARRGITEYIWRSETSSDDDLHTRIDQIGQRLVSAIDQTKTAPPVA